MLQGVSSRLTNTLPSFIVCCSHPPTKAHPVKLAVYSILQAWHETSMCKHTICTIAQLHGFIAHSQFWHVFSIFLLCNVSQCTNAWGEYAMQLIVSVFNYVLSTHDVLHMIKFTRLPPPHYLCCSDCVCQGTVWERDYPLLLISLNIFKSGTVPLAISSSLVI